MTGMTVLLTIGEFSKMTYLSVKALRHYHDVGLLEPVAVDPTTGYRQYAAGQVATAQAIRRFRDLDMPIEEVRRVLRAPDLATRNQVILRHLERMQHQLEQTQATVASLQALLVDQPDRTALVDIRRIPATRVLTASARVPLDDCAAFLEPAFADLRRTAALAGLTPAGPDGALYPDDLFEEGAGEVTAFVPVKLDGHDVVELPAVTAAVLLHEGSFADLDRAYATLGTVVAERGIGGPGPIREHYLSDTSTEVCWPITTGATP
jgi:DNA-binding transcriptional MerR regulator